MSPLRLTAATVATICLAFASDAAAADRLQVYDLRDIPDSTGLASGQILSSKGMCAQKRRFKLVALRAGKRKVLDHGLSSREGAVSGYFRDRDLRGADDGVFVANRTKRCPRLSGSLRDWSEGAERLERDHGSSKTAVFIVSVNGVDEDGAFGGILSATPRADCFRGRKMRLIADGKVLDKGITTANGAWALHVTQTEFDTTELFRVRVAKASTKKGQRCKPAGVGYGGGAD
jgi:hypothetical protein